MSVFVFTMQNGVTMIGDIISETDTEFTIKFPIILTPNDRYRNNIIGYRMFPFTDDDIIEVNKDKVMFFGNPTQELVDYYYELTYYYSESDTKVTYGMKGVVKEQNKFTEKLQEMLLKAKSTEDEEQSIILLANTTIH